MAIPIVLVALVLAAGGVTFLASKGKVDKDVAPEKRTIVGMVVLHEYNNIQGGGFETCRGGTINGFSDFKAGLGITIKDASGKIIGVDSLDNFSSKSEYVDQYVTSGGSSSDAYDELDDPDSEATDGCPLGFTLAVPDADFYSVEVDGNGDETFTREELEAANWHVRLTLG